MNKKNFFLLTTILFTTLFSRGNAAEITRVILASDTNPDYIQFWPVVASAWKKIIGIEPTLILVAEDDFPIDDSYGDVIRFKPIPNISTSLQAQVIRLLGGAYYPDEISIMSDIDMLPLSKRYFKESAKHAPDDHFIVFRNGHDNGLRFPMCYNAAKGSVAMEVFDIKSVDDIREKIITWAKEHRGWSTDEIVLTRLVKKWMKETGRVTYLNHYVSSRVDRIHYMEHKTWGYIPHLLRRGKYIDAHMLRPWNDYYEENMQIVHDLGLHID